MSLPTLFFRGKAEMTYVIVALAALTAGAIQTVTGFGAAVVLMLVLPRIFGVVTASAVSTSICVALSGVLAWELRKKTDFRLIALPTAVFGVCGIVIINLIRSLDLHILGILFGVFLLALSLYNLAFAKKASLRPTTPVILLSGAVSGTFSGLFSIGGPLMALCLLPCSEDHEQYIGNMQTLFVVTNIINIIARISNGLYTSDLLPYTLVGMAFILIGKEFGVRFVKKLNIEAIKKVIYVFVGISGALTLAENLF